MFPVEVIAVLGLLYGFFMIGILRAQWMKRAHLRKDSRVRRTRGAESRLADSSPAAK